MKCKNFVNANCAFYCPNAEMDAFENYYDIPAEDAGYRRIKCKDCQYNGKHCTCVDCYLQGEKECPERKEITDEANNSRYDTR